MTGEEKGTYCEACRRDCDCPPVERCEVCHAAPQQYEAWFRMSEVMVGKRRVCKECAKGSIPYEKFGDACFEIADSFQEIQNDGDSGSPST